MIDPLILLLLAAFAFYITVIVWATLLDNKQQKNI
jgi:hypothetical protein